MTICDGAMPLPLNTGVVVHAIHPHAHFLTAGILKIA
jgi:hypothetical protein